MRTELCLFAALLSLVSCQEISQPHTDNSYWSSWRDYWNAYWNRRNPYQSENKNTQSKKVEQSSTEEDVDSINLADLIRCKGSTDCLSVNISFVCVGATIKKDGYCLPSLKPMEYGCKLDEQCTKACPTSYCSSDKRFRNQQGDKQCRCKDAHYYLFKKCWKRCMATTDPVTDPDGTLRCKPRNTQNSKLYLRRNKRQIRSARIIC